MSYLVLHLKLYLGCISLACLQESPIAKSYTKLRAMMLTSVTPPLEEVRLFVLYASTIIAHHLSLPLGASRKLDGLFYHFAEVK